MAYNIIDTIWLTRSGEVIKMCTKAGYIFNSNESNDWLDRVHIRPYSNDCKIIIEDI